MSPLEAVILTIGPPFPTLPSKWFLEIELIIKGTLAVISPLPVSITRLNGVFPFILKLTSPLDVST